MALFVCPIVEENEVKVIER